MVDILAETGLGRFGFVEVCLVSIRDWLLDCELKASECEMKARWDARWDPWGRRSEGASWWRVLQFR